MTIRNSVAEVYTLQQIICWLLSIRIMKLFLLCWRSQWENNFLQQSTKVLRGSKFVFPTVFQINLVLKINMAKIFSLSVSKRFSNPLIKKLRGAIIINAISAFTVLQMYINLIRPKILGQRTISWIKKKLGKNYIVECHIKMKADILKSVTNSIEF